MERLPLFVQGAQLYAVACLILAPLFLIGTVLLLLERANPGSFDWYLTDEGLARGYGWVFGQGIVAVALVPALAAAAEIVATFGRRPLPTRRLITFALVMSAGLLLHLPERGRHRRPGGGPPSSPLVAAVPIAIAAVAIIAGGARALSATPVRFALGGAALLAIAGLKTAWLAIRHDDLAGTTFTTGRLGALWCGAMLALLGALTYWWPKLFGRLLDARLTALSSIVGFGSALLLVAGRMVAGEQGQPSHTGAIIDDAGDGGARGGDRHLRPARGLRAVRPCHRQEPQRAPGGQRSLAGGHARVVHDLATAAGQLRHGAADHERSAARRPAAHA